MLLLFSIFSIFFLVDIRSVKTLNELKMVGGIQSFSLFIIITLMSFAGVPPLLGFSGKFLIFLSLFSKSNWVFLFFFSFVNIFLMYFYVQNFRFVVTKQINKKIFFSNTFVKNSNLITFVILFNFLNLFGIIYIEEFLIYFNYVASSLYI